MPSIRFCSAAGSAALLLALLGCGEERPSDPLTPDPVRPVATSTTPSGTPRADGLPPRSPRRPAAAPTDPDERRRPGSAADIAAKDLDRRSR